MSYTLIHTVTVDIEGLVVYVQHAAKTFFGRQEGPVARPDVPVELKVSGNLVQLVQPGGIINTAIYHTRGNHRVT